MLVRWIPVSDFLAAGFRFNNRTRLIGSLEKRIVFFRVNNSCVFILTSDQSRPSTLHMICRVTGRGLYLIWKLRSNMSWPPISSKHFSTCLTHYSVFAKSCNNPAILPCLVGFIKASRQRGFTRSGKPFY